MKPLDFSNHRSAGHGPAPNIAIRAAIAPLAALGWTGLQIAKHLGMSRNAVIGHCFRGGITLKGGPNGKTAPKRQPTEAERQMVTEMAKAGLTAKAAANRLGVPISHVMTIANAAGLVFATGQARRARKPRLAQGATLPAVRGLDGFKVEDGAAFSAENTSIAASLPEFNPFAPRPARHADKAYDDSRLPGVALTDLERGECRWPLNDPARGQAFLFCAAPVAAPVVIRGRTQPASYCACHMARAVSAA